MSLTLVEDFGGMTFPSDRTKWLGLIVLLLTLVFVAVLPRLMLAS